MRLKILMDELKNAATLFLKFLSFFFYYNVFAWNPPLRIIHSRISNNLNKEFTIHVQHSRQIVVLVSVLPELAEQSQFLCRVSDDFGSRILSMVPLSKSFHNVVIFLLQ